MAKQLQKFKCFNLTKLIALLIALAFAFSFNINAYANQFNKSFLTNEFWADYEEADIVNFNFGDDAPVGVMKYYIDTERNAVYLNVKLSNVDKPINECVKLHFDFFNDSSEYHFAVDENGICDYEGNEAECFSTIQNFDKASNGVYIAGVGINDGSYINQMTFTLYFNGRNYILIKSRNIDATPTTLPPDSTTSTTKAVVTTKSTTKQKTTAVKTTKFKTTKPTKFVAHYNPAEASDDESKSTTAYKGNPLVPQTGDDEEISNRIASRRAVVSATIGAFLIVLSIVCLIIYLFNQKNHSAK